MGKTYKNYIYIALKIVKTINYYLYFCGRTRAISKKTRDVEKEKEQVEENQKRKKQTKVA